jgi:DNA-directed RNA polymerase subunit RPC12/RpoP
MDESPLIKFRCENCGQRISVPQIYTGQKSKCPHCKNTVVIPPPTDREHSDIGLKSLLDPAMFDVPPKQTKEQEPPPVNQPGPLEKEVAPEPVLDAAAFDIPPEPAEPEKTAVDYFKKLEEPPPERKFPFLLDIFLYPLNVPGLAILGIVIGIPLIFQVLGKLLFLFMLVFPPAFVLLALLSAVSFVVGIALPFYFYWYLAECVRSSACGELRSPETIGTTPGTIGEMVWQTIKILLCLIFFFAPVLIYFFTATKANLLFMGETNERMAVIAAILNDKIFWLLLSYGIFFFPIGLLSVVMFDSIAGLNPILLIGSIFSTFLPYCGLILFFYAFGYLIVKINQFLGIVPFAPQFWAYMSLFITCYLLMIMAHFLGRFCWRYEEKLSWDV